MEKRTKREVRIYADLAELSRNAAQTIAGLANESLKKREKFSIALSGGKTPLALYRILGSEYRDTIPWWQVHLFWGDERFVPQDDPQSNYGQASNELIRNIPIPESNVHPMPVDLHDPEVAAREYERELKNFFKTDPPIFDLILLGVGNDGHTASLFPGSPSLKERDRWVVSVVAPIEPPRRLSLTIPVLCSAQTVLFLVSGSDKRQIVREVFSGHNDASETYPAGMVSGRERTIWFLDQAAAELL